MELTGEQVTTIVRETLEEWLPGYTAYDEKTNIQYRITFIGNGRYRITLADERSVSKTFQVGITVREEVPRR